MVLERVDVSETTLSYGLFRLASLNIHCLT